MGDLAGGRRRRRGVVRGVLGVVMGLVLPAGAAEAQPRSGPAVADSADVFRFEEVVVTAARRALPRFDAPRTVSVVPARALREGDFATAPDALRELPGVLVQKTNMGGGSPFIRGLTGKQVLILVDGVRLNNATFRFGPNQYLNTVDPYALAQVEVVHGPGSVLYGSDALGGVVHLRTRLHAAGEAPNRPARLRVHQRLASADRGRAARVDVDGGSDGWAYTAGGSLKRFGDLRAGSGPSPVGAVDVDGAQPYTGYDEVALNAGFRYRLGARGTVRAGYLFARQGEVPKSNALIRSDYLTAPDVRNVFAPQQLQLGYFGYEVSPGGFVSQVRLRGSANVQTEGRERRRQGWTKTRFERDRVRSLGFGVQATSAPWRGHLLVGGVEGYHDAVASSRYERADDGVRADLPGRFPDGTTYATLGLFLKDTWQPVDRVAVHLGTRYSRFRIRTDFGGLTIGPVGPLDVVRETYADLTWSADLRWRIRPDAAAYASVARGFRAPNVDDLAVEGAWDSGRDVPNPDVDPETVVQIELGVKVDRLRGSAGAAVYQGRFRDLIQRSYLHPGADGAAGTPDDLFQFDNVARAVIRGAEGFGRWTAVRGRRGLVSLFGHAAWVWGENQTDDAPIRRIPPAMGLVGVRGERAGAWAEGFVRGAARQDRLSPGDERDERIPAGGTPGWITLNLRGGVRVTDRLEVQLALENLTDGRYRVHGSGIDAPGFNAVLGVTATW